MALYPLDYLQHITLDEFIENMTHVHSLDGLNARRWSSPRWAMIDSDERKKVRQPAFRQATEIDMKIQLACHTPSALAIHRTLLNVIPFTHSMLRTRPAMNSAPC